MYIKLVLFFAKRKRDSGMERSTILRRQFSETSNPPLKSILTVLHGTKKIIFWKLDYIDTHIQDQNLINKHQFHCAISLGVCTVTDQQEPKQEPKTDQQEPKTDQQEPKTDQQEPKTDQQEPKTDQQEPKTDQQEPKTDQQEPKQDSKSYHQQDITKIDQQDITKTDQQDITKIDQRGSKSERFSRFLGEMVSFSDSELKTAGYIRALTEWLFDLLRNILMVGFLFYLAKRTNNSILHVAAGVANAMLLVYLLSYLNTWSIRPYQTYYRLQKPSVVDLIIMILLAGLIVLLIYIGIPYVANQIASAYETQKSDLAPPTNDSFAE